MASNYANNLDEAQEIGAVVQTLAVLETRLADIIKQIRISDANHQIRIAELQQELAQSKKDRDFLEQQLQAIGQEWGMTCRALEALRSAKQQRAEMPATLGATGAARKPLSSDQS